MKCTDKEWQHCRVEKMGCPGCAYDENKIKIGDYIRTNEGLIGKIKRIELDKIDKSLKWYVFDKKRPNMNIVDEIYINKPYITKYSKNIVDLLECEDILKIDVGFSYIIFFISTITKDEIIDGIHVIAKKDIKNFEIIDGCFTGCKFTLLTKEQFNKNCFEVVQE